MNHLILSGNIFVRFLSGNMFGSKFPFMLYAADPERIYGISVPTQLISMKRCSNLQNRSKSNRIQKFFCIRMVFPLWFVFS